MEYRTILVVVEVIQTTCYVQNLYTEAIWMNKTR